MGQSALILVLMVIVRYSDVQASRLDAEGKGSPCYEYDEQGNEDLTKPQVSKQ